MNWDNQDKDPWGGKNDAPDFDDLLKKFSSVLGAKKATSSNGSGSGGGFGGLFGQNSESSSKIKYECLVCHKVYNARECPRCGSTMKRAMF